MKLIFWIVLLFHSPSFAFLLVDPDYRLAKPENTVVNIASGGCQANGMSNDELTWAINESLKKYWNTVSESRLWLAVGIEVSRTLSDGADPGEILVGCAAMGASGPSGVAVPDPDTGSATVTLNASTFVPGGYYPEGLLGVLSHELGHAVGLDHSADPASIMTYEDNEWGAMPKFLSQDDKNGVVYLYPNKSNLGGLLGGCSAVALGIHGSQTTMNIWLFLFELALILGCGWWIRGFLVLFSKAK